jgi:hypothetical protein
MTELATTPLIESDPGTSPRAVTEARMTAVPSPPLITEQEVLLGSAAALRSAGVPHRSLRNVLRAFFAFHATPRPEGTPRHYPQHYAFIESAAMAREMYRL